MVEELVMIDAVKVTFDVHGKGRGNQPVLPGSLNIVSECEAYINGWGSVMSSKLSSRDKIISSYIIS